MKYTFLSLLIGMLLTACEICNDPNSCSTQNGIYCKATFVSDYIRQKDSLLFTESDIKWFNTSTSELRLKNQQMMIEIQNFRNFKFYIGTDSLFTAELVLDIMSSVNNDLVLYFSSLDNKLYLADGYPMWMDNPEITSIRNQNKEKRAVAWKKFTDRLRKTGKLRS